MGNYLTTILLLSSNLITAPWKTSVTNCIVLSSKNSNMLWCGVLLLNTSLKKWAKITSSATKTSFKLLKKFDAGRDSPIMFYWSFSTSVAQSTIQFQYAPLLLFILHHSQDTKETRLCRL